MMHRFTATVRCGILVAAAFWQPRGSEPRSTVKHIIMSPFLCFCQPPMINLLYMFIFLATPRQANNTITLKIPKQNTPSHEPPCHAIYTFLLITTMCKPDRAEHTHNAHIFADPHIYRLTHFFPKVHTVANSRANYT
ncbi:hypothetical protein B0J18DRAFT_25786 [Chaetomium sp. MPI-SDFR-AT-0129]|nr:hypothetical protein B0J18DRAFT_25786 [Chaetomium sp. MPI-SDFR-AT-0129]